MRGPDSHSLPGVSDEDAHALQQQLHSSHGGGVCMEAALITAQLEPQSLDTLQIPELRIAPYNWPDYYNINVQRVPVLEDECNLPPEGESELLPDCDVCLEPLEVSPVSSHHRLSLPLPVRVPGDASLRLCLPATFLGDATTNPLAVQLQPPPGPDTKI